MCVRNIKNIKKKKILQLTFILYYIKFKYQIYKNNWMKRDVWSCLNPKPLGHTYLKLNVNYRNFLCFLYFLHTS